MAKRTKTQKRNVAKSMAQKARILFMEGMLSASDVDVVEKLVNKAMKKC